MALDPGSGARDLERLYTTAQLARILGLPIAELRKWVRHGLIRPVREVRRLAFFDFRQVAGAKALARLFAAGVGPKRLRKSLEQLSQWWPEAARTLAQLETLEDRSEVLIRTPDGGLAEPSGQLRLDFESEPDDRSTPAAERLAEWKAPEASSPPDKRGAGDVLANTELWFRRGVELEESDRPEEAVLAYARALGPSPKPETAFNLGNVLFALQKPEEAAQCFALATEIDSEYVEAWNNLGNALAALERHAEAADALRRALRLEPDYADAHFNLGETLAAQGHLEEAKGHWLAYLKLDPSSTWADEVRARLRRID